MDLGKVPPAGAEPPDFRHLPEDALIMIYTLLPPYSLRAAAMSNAAWRHALTRAPQHVRHRAAWLHHWTVGSAGACIQRADSAVCTGDGTWHPGGVALAGTLQLSITSNAGFRLVCEHAAPGDLLMGITLHQPAVAPPSAASDSQGSCGGMGGSTDGSGDSDGGAGEGGGNGACMATSMDYKYLEMGYHYLMGRGLDADGSIQTSPPPGGGGGVAPRSIFYGGRSRRCCFATPTPHSRGPTVDTGPDGRTPGTLAKLRHVGDWVSSDPLVDSAAPYLHPHPHPHPPSPPTPGRVLAP